MNRGFRLLVGLLLPCLLLLVWELLTRAQILPPSLSTPLSTVATTLLDLGSSREFGSHMLSSLARLTIGVLTGSLIGIATGLTLSQVQPLRTLFGPTIRFLAPIPVIVWMPFIIALAGTQEAYKVVMVAVATFFVMHGHSFDGGSAVSDRHLELARIYRKPFHARIMKIILPAATPLIFTGLRLSLAFAWVILLFVEFGSAHAGSEGLGWFVADARALGRVEDEYAGVVAIAFLGLLTDIIAAGLCAHASRWSDKSQV